MATYLDQFDSLTAFLTHIARSGTESLGPGSSTRLRDFSGQADLPTFVEQCRTLQRPDFPARAALSDGLAATLTGDLPAGVSLRRQPVWGRSGASVSVQKVLRGDLGHAWRRTVRQATVAAQGALVLLLPASVSAAIDHTQIQWSAVATIALADYARRAGRRVEIWSIGYNVAGYDSGKDYCWMVPLVRAGQSWDSSAVCLATYPEWLRRLGFRALEMTEAQEGAISPRYGGVLPADRLLAFARERWAPQSGLAPESLLLGCTQHDHVSTRDTAERWVQAQLTTLADAA